jgi:hypothetical protein
MANLEKRGNYVPRRTREQRAYRLLIAGSASGVVGVVALVLAVAGTISAIWPILLIAIAAVCGLMFRGLTTRR